MLLLCLVAVCSASYFATTEALSCSWTNYPGQSIDGGQAAQAGSLAACQAICAQAGSCQSIDFDPSSNGCWLLGTKSGKRSNPGIQHYDYDCQAVRDVLAGTGDPRCFKTNYKGSVSDFASASNGVDFGYEVAHFDFDFPQGFFVPAINIYEISFSGADNLAYFRVVFHRNRGSAITTKALTPDKRSLELDGVTSVKKAQFYLVPLDYRRNITLYNVLFTTCPKGGLLGFVCDVIDFVKAVIEVGTLGIIKPGDKPGTFRADVEPSVPFIELDLGCSGVGSVAFSQLKFDRFTNIDRIIVSIWNGPQRVTVIRNDNVVTDLFNPAAPIVFASGVVGNRIRVSFIPLSDPNLPISGSIWFSSYQILAG